MKNVRLIFLKIILCLLLAAGSLYALFLYALPYVLNSNKIIAESENFLKEKTNLDLNIENFHFKTNPDLTISINADKIYLNNSENKPVLKTNKPELKIDLKRWKRNYISIDYIYADEFELRKLIKSNSSREKTDFNLNPSVIPDIDIKNAEIWIDRDKENSVFIILDNIKVSKAKDKKLYCTFKADILSPMLKNLIHTGDSGFLYIENNALYAKNMEIIVGFPHILIDGLLIDKNKKSDFTIKGDNLPVDDIETSLLYFLKLRKPGKQFLENFQNFGGNIDIDLKIKDLGLFGRCSAENLQAESVLFNIPIVFKKVFFDFNNREITSEAVGTFGGEKVTNSFKLTNMATDEQEVTGHVNSFITDKLTSKYIPAIKIKGGADTSVDYRVKNHKINVDYLLNLKPETEFVYRNSYLGMVDKTRRILVNTIKDNDKLFIKHYDYSIVNGKNVQNVILGDGLMIKNGNHLEPDFITCRTNGFVPITIAGSFGKVVEGGFFDGDLKYDYNKNLVTGDFTVKDTKYKKFYAESAKILADEKNIKVDAEGKYQKSPFKCRLNAENKIDKNSIHVIDMALMLEEYIVDTSSNNKPKIDTDKVINQIQEKTDDIKLVIEHWLVKINKIKREKVELNNILLEGSVNNDIFKFIMPPVYFAKGALKANGLYNLDTGAAEVDFQADKIDSNTVAAVIFDLPDQIAGTANAKLHANAQDNFKSFDGYAEFAINQGYLPKIGSTEFIIKKSKKVKREFKFKLSDIINADIKNMKALASDINGSFYLADNTIKDLELTSKQKYLSMLIEGSYNIGTQQADLNLYGKYNKTAEKKVKILFVPLNWIVNIVFRPEYTFDKYKHKIKKIPSIEADCGEEKMFRVKLTGDLNNDDIHVEMKRIMKD